MKCGKSSCFPRSVISITVLSVTLILFSLISIISSETIAKSADYDSTNDLDPIESNSENNFIQNRPLKQNFEYLKGIISKRANIRYLRNVLDALDNKLERFQRELLREYRPKRVSKCLSGLPAADCENNHLGLESLGQEFLRPGGRNPGR